MVSPSISVKISSDYTYAGFPLAWFRQTPNNDGVWGDLAAYVDGDDFDADWLIVIDQPHRALATTAPVERRILFVTEPPGIRAYSARYANQFGTVVSPYAIPGFRGREFIQQSALYWHYGLGQNGAIMQQWASLAADKPKSRLASVICSSKATLPHQRQRLAFVERLMTRLGDRVDHFGHGVHPINDKQEAIAAYKYHIVLENNAIDHFWTEKLADSYLGDSFPIFSGCANIEHYFDQRSLLRINIFDPDRAIDEIARVLDSTTWEGARDHVREARRRVMNEYNLFSVIATIVAQNVPHTHSAPRVAPTVLSPLARRRLKAFRRRLRAYFGRVFTN